MHWPTYLTTTTSLVALTSATLTTPLKRQTFDYPGTALYHHNVHRTNHSANALVWDDGLASTALKIAQTCVYAHNMNTDGGGYGQNIAASLPDTSVSSSISDLWYNGEVNSFLGLYGQPQPSYANFGAWGHFTQMVWKGTTSVGCATSFCGQGLQGVGSNVPPWFTVCNYKGPGNYANEYADNVGEPLGQPTVKG